MLVVTIYKGSSSKCITVLFALFLIIPTSSKKQFDLIYVLQFTHKVKDSWDTYWNLYMGQEAFVSRNCSYQNCYLTQNRLYFDSILDFDVLLFNAEHTTPSEYWTYTEIPLNRSEHQLYILLSSEPAALYPLSDFYNGVFNATWTYKFSSDIFHPFFVVKNNLGEVIGPKIDMDWTNNTDIPPANSSIVQKLKTKRIAAAWVASAAHCGNSYSRYDFVNKLRHELSKYGHIIDVYGTCGNLLCPSAPLDRAHLLYGCNNKIQSDYYFYLAFENSFSEDYVSEKVLHGLQHFSVPIVFGGANYTRFLPDGSYIDAFKLGEQKLAKEMNDIINDPPRYYDFFKWHGYYSFQDTTDSDHRESICELCAFLNKQRLNKSVRVYHNITDWWNSKYIIPLKEYSTPNIPTQRTPIEKAPEHTESVITKFLDFLFDE